jgi:hypothetical protein
MTHQDEMIKGYRGLLNWGQRIADECGAVGSQNNFTVIEDTLNQQRERIAELEAQRDQARVACVDRNQQITELRALNAALVSQSAGGARVQMEYSVTHHPNGVSRESFMMASKDGWQFVQHIPRSVEHCPYTIWQRPARNEVEE